ncbi:coenzyme A pyrophosphatase [Echinicola pacifica]|uniref:Coenzyme A pyrophosphatase n=1 Tax=Echinicola pacifica TaxID=346377 RepID=A0A918PPW8_9BACT|nr:CoA pyrophosphatase [Echinicola pacifica]GGZ16345.1 coenzyme A pyrophosphatase [Echinicola pacifica]
MDFSQFINILKVKLSGPLPGREGQLVMAPKPVDEARFGGEEQVNARKGAVMILFYEDQNKFFFPLIKRPEYDGTHAGQMALPGGKVEPEDGSLSQTALRETEEEIGVKASDIEVIGALSQLYIPPSNFLVSPFIGLIRHKPLFIPDPREVAAVVPCDFDVLIDQDYHKSTMIKVNPGFSLKAPYFDINKEVVWGATAMMLGELVSIWNRK